MSAEPCPWGCGAMLREVPGDGLLDALEDWCAAFDASLPPPGTSLTIEPSCAALREAWGS